MVKRLRFGVFELDPETGELRRGGRRVWLQPQPAELLLLLAERPGEVVTREEIRQRLWGDRFVDVDPAINFCVRQLRRALGESARLPTSVETVPRKGYRFVARVKSFPPQRDGAWRRAPSIALGLAASVVAALSSLLILWDDTPSAPTEAEQVAAGLTYAKAQAELASRTDESARLARALFEVTVDLDPTSARGHAGLAAALLSPALWEPPPSAEIATAISRALELDSSLAPALRALGDLRFYRLWDWQGARSAYSQSLQLAPGDATIHQSLAHLFLATGQPDEALRHQREALDLDPTPHRRLALGWLYFRARDYENAGDLCRQVLNDRPDWTAAHRCLMHSNWRLGRLREAHLASIRLAELYGVSPEDVSRLSGLDAESGIQSYLQLKLDYFYRRLSKGQPLDSALIALTLADMGNAEGALEWLDDALRERSRNAPFLATEPRWDTVRTEAGFDRHLTALRLPLQSPTEEPSRTR